MPETFDNLKPWPGGEGPPAHHNQPPLEAQITLDFDEALRRRGLDARAIEIAAAAERCPVIDSREIAGKAGDVISAARALSAEIDAERETLNRPLLTAQRNLKARADGILAPVNENVAFLRQRLDEFMAGQPKAVHGDYGARVGTRAVWQFEIVEPAKLPLAIRRHPDVLAALEKVVRGHVKNGARSIAGVRIWKGAKASVR